jgi:putative transposase
LGLQLRNKTPKRKVKAKLREDRQPASGPKDVWAMDFLHDQLFDGRKIRILVIIDTFGRFSPALDPRFAYEACDVVQTLELASKAVGYPRVIRVDNGPEFVSRDLHLDPQAFITSVINRIVDGHPQSQIDLLMPWNYRA